jgi:HAE1 family hydrophobic/amphiphilic exporter-1
MYPSLAGAVAGAAEHHSKNAPGSVSLTIGGGGSTFARRRVGVNVSETFIRRPIATSLLMLGVAMFGVIAYRALPVADLPKVDFPTLNVGASLVGADPATMASAVANPLERQFTTIAGIDEMTSSSSTGSTNITLQFSLDRDLDSAAVDVQTAIAAVMPLLPAGMPAPPSFRKFNPADQPIIILGVGSTTLPLSTINDYAENVIAPAVSMINGVSQVNVNGSQKFAVRVQVNPEALKAQSIGLNEIDQALQNWNVNLPTGQLFGPVGTFNLKVGGQLVNADAFRPLVVAYRRGAPLRLDQVATVIDSVEDNKTAAWFYTRHGIEREIVLAIMRQPGANTIDIADGVRQLIPRLEEQLPAAINLGIRIDRSTAIRKAFSEIRLTMVVTLVLVVGVIFVFLGNLSATLIPALALPFSLLGTFAVMQLLNFSLNNLSMMALILSIGFVVDDAIVMLENIVRHLERGEDRLTAALKGSKEIVFTILSMTTSLAAVFIPILFMRGVLGRLFREFAVTIASAILISGIVSLTLTPMLCSRFLRVGGPAAAGPFVRVSNRLYQAMFRLYERSLRVVLRHRIVLLLLFVGVLISTIWMYRVVPKGFIPDQDTNELNLRLRAAQGTSYYEMVDNARKVADIVMTNPHVQSFPVVTGSFGGGGGGIGAMNTAMFPIIALTPRADRTLSAADIARQIRGQLLQFPAFRAFVNLPPSLQIGGRMGDSSYSLTLQSANTEELYAWAPRLSEAISRLGEVQDVSNDMEMKSPRVNLVLDRDKAAAVGLSAAEVENALYSGFGPKWSSTIYGDRSQYRVLLELEPRYQAYADSLQKIAFKTREGALVPLESIVAFRETVGPQTVNHVGQLPAVNISFGLRPGISLGAATDAIKALTDRILPATLTTSFQGQARVFQASMQNLGLLLFVAIGVVYIVLGMLYESYVHPITILSGLPSAGLGALVTLWLFGNELNIYSFVGLVMLIGIVKKNAIMQIDFALDVERKQGKAAVDAIYEGCLIRFRPIMMTTMAALLGSLPIALGLGAGGEARRPLGLAVVGGLLFSQLMTLYLTPVVYTYMASVLNVIRRPRTQQGAYKHPSTV